MFAAIKYPISVSVEQRAHNILARCQLYEQIGDQKRAIEGYQLILPLLGPSEVDKYFKLAISIAKVGLL